MVRDVEKERFEPESKKELYIASFQTRRKEKEEGWADFGEDVRLLADKAFSDLSEDVRERLALNSYLGQLSGNPQLAVGVRQQRPKSFDEAVRATLEVESYLLPGAGRVAGVSLEDPVVAAVQSKQDTVLDLLRDLTLRMERLETTHTTTSRDRETNREDPRRRDTERRRPAGYLRRRRERMVCWECGKMGHPARQCPGNHGNY